MIKKRGYQDKERYQNYDSFIYKCFFIVLDYIFSYDFQHSFNLKCEILIFWQESDTNKLQFRKLSHRNIKRIVYVFL